MRRTPTLTRRLAWLGRVALAATGCLVVACSGQGAKRGGSGGQGSPGAGGGGDGGSRSGGTTVGATIATGGVVATGGASGNGGLSGGVALAGGALSTGGAHGGGGGATLGSDGADGGRDGRTSLDGSQGGLGSGGAGRGGAGGTGGVVGTGGVSVTGGLAAGGSSGGADRCDVGVYDEASPPKVLSLSGSYPTHDPSALAADGAYALFCTGLGAWTSTNLTTWRSAGRPFAAPAWLTSAVPGVGDLWAPDISEFGGKFHLYYSGSTFGSNKSCIGHATRAALASGAWTDDGAATLCSNVGTTDNWNAIDPNVIIDTDGAPWLTLGSFWSGIKVIPLDGQGKRVGSTVTALASRPQNGGALEAPFMVRRCGYYYLFMSWDVCCKGADSTYNIRVVRGTSVTGPFVDKAGTAALQGGGTLIAQGNATFAGPGGQSVMFEGKRAYLVYHAYARSNGAITLRIADLVWDASGWPVPVGP